MTDRIPTLAGRQLLSRRHFLNYARAPAWEGSP